MKQRRTPLFFVVLGYPLSLKKQDFHGGLEIPPPVNRCPSQFDTPTVSFSTILSTTKMPILSLFTKLSTLSTQTIFLIHIVIQLDNITYQPNTTLCTSYPQIVHKYECSLLTNLLFCLSKKHRIRLNLTNSMLMLITQF